MRFFIVCFCLWASMCVNAQTQVGRYLTVPGSLTVEQVSPFQQTFQMILPNSVQTIGAAIRLIISNTGYQLLSRDASDSTIGQLMDKPVPLAMRNIQSSTVKNVLLGFVGEPFQLVIDPVHKIITFKLKDNYQSVFS